MTFASDTTRLLFHQLPTPTQVQFTELEERLAEQQQRLHVEAVRQDGNTLEVVVRITEHFEHSAAGAH